MFSLVGPNLINKQEFIREINKSYNKIDLNFYFVNNNIQQDA